MLGNLQSRYPGVAMFFTMIPYILLLLEKEYKNAFKGISLILIVFFLNIYFSKNATGLFATIILFMTILLTRLLPGLIMGKYTLISTDMSEMVCAMRKMRLPDQIIIPMTVLSRFFYTLREDYSQIKDAMKLHGLVTRKLFFNPVKLFEYRVIPLLMCMTRTADEVAISAMTRGLDVGKPRSSISEIKLRAMDYLFFLLMIFLLVLYIRGKYA